MIAHEQAFRNGARRASRRRLGGYAALAEEGAETGTEQQRRESSLQSIDEILERRPLAAFSATHLALLEMLFAYWRETEVADDAPVRASVPDAIQ